MTDNLNAAYDERSGWGRQSEFPMELLGWNWGAAGLTWIWGWRHRVWISLLALLPGVGLIMFIFLGINGNEWAWKARKWESVEVFLATQKKWRPWGIAAFSIFALLMLGTFIYTNILNSPPPGPFAFKDGQITYDSAWPMVTLEGKEVKYKFAYNFNRWERITDKAQMDEDAEYEFRHRLLDVTAEIIPESHGGVGDVADLTFQRIKEKHDPEAEVLSKITRMVNGGELAFQKMRVTLRGVPYIFFGDFYTGKEATIQFVVSCPEVLVDKYIDDIMELLNSLEIL